MKKEDKLKLLKKVHKLKEVGFNSLQVSNRLGIPLIRVNKFFATSVPGPENKKIWIKNTRYDNLAQKKEAEKAASR